MYDYKSNENYLKFDRFILDVCKSLILSSRKNKISVIGSGYVGLSNAILLSQNNNVHLFDIDKEKIDMVNCKTVFIIEAFKNERKYQDYN